MVASGKFTFSLDVSSSSAKSVKDFLDTSTLLHRDNSKLILLIDPDQESLGVIVEDTSARWPVSVEVACNKESVSLPKVMKKLKFELLFII